MSGSHANVTLQELWLETPGGLCSLVRNIYKNWESEQKLRSSCCGNQMKKRKNDEEKTTRLKKLYMKISNNKAIW